VATAAAVVATAAVVVSTAVAVGAVLRAQLPPSRVLNDVFIGGFAFRWWGWGYPYGYYGYRYYPYGYYGYGGYPYGYGYGRYGY
jgi:hypothetical protein